MMCEYYPLQDVSGRMRELVIMYICVFIQEYRCREKVVYGEETRENYNWRTFTG